MLSLKTFYEWFKSWSLEGSYRSLKKIICSDSEGSFGNLRFFLFSTSLNSQIWKYFPAWVSVQECPKWNCWEHADSMWTFTRLTYFIYKLFKDFLTRGNKVVYTCFGLYWWWASVLFVLEENCHTSGYQNGTAIPLFRLSAIWNRPREGKWAMLPVCVC